MAMQFDTTYYLQQNPDVFAAVLAGTIPSAEWHYENYGWIEGRNPNATFNTYEYLLANPDVLEAHIDPFQHFLTYGAAEGRAPNDEFVTRADFDWETYLDQNPDLAAAGIDTQAEAYQHFVTYGYAENRPGVQTNEGTPIGSNGVPGESGGETFTLTAGIDSGAAFTGTDGNDTFQALEDGDLSVDDSIDGGAGTDKLLIRNLDSNTGPFTAKNIETIDVRSSNDAAVVNLSGASGYTSLVANAPTNNITFSNILATAGAALTVQNASTDTKVMTFTYAAGELAGSEDSVTLNLNGISAGITVNVGDSGAGKIETLNIVTDSSNTGTITLGDDADDATTIKVSGAGMLDISGAPLTKVTSFDASDASGGVTVDFLGNSEDVTATFGDGDDDVTLDGSGLDDSDSIDGGAGDDTLHIDLDASVTDNDLDIKNFETIAFAGVTANVNIDLDGVEGLTTLQVDADGTAANTIEVKNLDQSVETIAFVGDGAAANQAFDGLKVEFDGSDAVENLSVTIANKGETAGTVEVNDLQIVNVEELTITATDVGTSLDLGTISGADLTKVTVSSDGEVIGTSVDAANVTDIDFSGADEGVTLTIANASDADVTLGDGDDTFTGSADDETITAGDGADTITGRAGADTIDLEEDTEASDLVDFAGHGAADTDSVSFFTTTSDDLSFDGVTVIGGGSITATSGTAVTAGTVTAGALSDDTVYVINDGSDALTAAGTESIADYEDLADVAAYLDEGYTSTADNDAAVFVINDLVNDVTYVYLFDEQIGGASTIQAADLSLIGIVNETNGAALVAGDIA